MRDGLLDIVSAIHRALDLPVLLLFQHPSPSKDQAHRQALAVATRDSVVGLTSMLVSAVHYVHDTSTSTTQNCWPTEAL